MVINNPINVSRYTGSPPGPSSSIEARKISGGPIYGQAEVLALAEAASIQPWSRGAIDDAQKWGLDSRDLAQLVELAVTSGRYRGSEWCEARSTGPWAACDAYTVTRLEWHHAAHKELRITYYLKFAISKTGSMLLSISNHPEGA